MPQLNRVKAAEKERESLEGPKNEACEFIRQDNELIMKKFTLSQTFVPVDFSPDSNRGVGLPLKP